MGQATPLDLTKKKYNDEGYLVLCMANNEFDFGCGGTFSSTKLMGGRVKGFIYPTSTSGRGFKTQDEFLMECNNGADGCRMFRKDSTTAGSPVFYEPEWVSLTSAGSGTPGTGEGSSLAPRTSSPTRKMGPTPSPIPYGGKGKGKGNGKGPKSPKVQRVPRGTRA